MQSNRESNYVSADRNLTIARDLLNHNPSGLLAPAYEWVVIISFYSAVRCINGWIEEQTGLSPANHGQRFRHIRNDQVLRELLEDYSMLRSWSEEARYTAPPSSFSSELAGTAIRLAASIRDHVYSNQSPE